MMYRPGMRLQSKQALERHAVSPPKDFPNVAVGLAGRTASLKVSTPRQRRVRHRIPFGNQGEDA